MGQSKADKHEADRKKKCAKLLAELGSETPLPAADALKNKSSRWKDVNWTNVHLLQKIITALALEDLPKQSTFKKDGGKGGNRGVLHGYVTFLFQEQATQKRQAEDALEREKKKKRGECDLALPGLGQPAREAAWRSALLDPSNLEKLKLQKAAFLKRTGGAGDGFWVRLNQERKGMMAAKAKADGEVRVMTRKVKLPDAFKPGQPNDGAMPFGAGTDEMTGAWSIGDSDDEYIIGVVEKAVKRRGVSLDDIGVDVALVLLKAKSSQEQKLRRHGMDNIGRSVTKAVTTIRDLGLLGVRAGERCSSRLVAELRIAATRDAPEVSALGDSNRGEALACLTTCGDAPSIGFGAAAGGVLGGGAAPRGAFRLGRLGAAVRRAAAVSASAPASLGDAVKGYNWEQLVVDRASRLRSASREPSVTVTTDTGSTVSLDLTSQTFLADFARLASPDLSDVAAINAALDERELHETPGGEMAQLLLKWGLMGIDPLTGKGVAGPFIETCEDIDEEEARKKGGTYAKGKFYAPKILHLALQKAILSGKLHFERDMLTLFYCIFGKLFFALLFYAGRITMLKARAMGFDPTLVPLELPCEDLPMVDPSIAKRFPGGISFESSGDLYKILSATNDSFFDEGKCLLWALAFAAYYGADHPLARAALAAVGARKDDHERAASRVAACKKAIAAFATGGGSSARSRTAAPALPPPPPPVMKRCGGCAPCRRKDGSPCNNPVPRGPVQGLAATDGAAAPPPFLKFPSLKAACDAAVTSLEFQIRFAKPAKGPGEPPMTEWFEIRDFVPVMRVLSGTKSWDVVRSHAPWVLESETCRAMEAAACASSAIFAGMRITEIAPPHSVAHVFDPTKECKHDQTYTIWAGVDFEIMLPGGTIISKSEFLLQELEKYMAARV